ncbi:LPS export ABC transporter periplasmic protein LptC [Flavobacterium sp. F372]|jgi:LPS export ABC transporter protein LptC|uniref:LPS export ABC transporter periplasmic protein LptC n=2 Tax=Flavobacterium bernardetii TaxID=2813823 RepID=A0ABR7J1H8_9FLAO|nr:LPS export ABC transporter periplasmic protein LptC [Flavobacterium bernardetii]NHF69567.1 LPS export ABC transporter periplasmic protein LptC [Flavobacterium bernardetii]
MINGLEKHYIINKMKKFVDYILVLALVLVLQSCESNLKDVQRIYKTSFVPTGEADSINLKYTDSGKVKSTVQSLKMVDYSTAKNPFVEFPKAVLVTLYDDNGNRTTVVADKAISYKRTEVIDLIGNVKIATFDGKVLETSQLYFDQKNEWFFTEEPFKFKDADGSFLQGVGIDFSKDFKIFNMQNNNGEVNNMNK